MSPPELEGLCEIAASFYARGYAFGSTGNLSVRLEDKVWITPTGVSLRRLKPEHLACIGLDGQSLNGNRPSKEFPFHLGAYRSAGERAGAIVHLHSTHCVALSCLRDLDPQRPLPAMTPYFLMRVAPLAMVPYFRPGSPELAEAVTAAAVDHDAILLRNHGCICLGKTLAEAVDRTEELEETARLYFLLRGERTSELTREQQDEIWRVFRSR